MAPSDPQAATQNGDRLDTDTAAPEPKVPALRPAPAAPAPKTRKWLWVLGGITGVFLVTLAYFQFWVVPVPTVAVEVARLAPVTRVLGVNGRIAAVHTVDVKAVVTGTITTLFAAEGDLVVTGQPLVQIDAAAQTAVVRQAMAALDAALVTQQQATQDHDRAVALGSNIARSLLETRANALEAATQEVVRQAAILEQAQIQLGHHTIHAPIDGKIITLDAEVGQTISPNTPLLSLADPDDLVVEADVDEAYATQIAIDQPALMQLAGETTTRNGRVSFVSGSVDVNTGGLAVRLAFDDRVTAPIGLTVATNIIVDQRDAALTLPRTALLSGADDRSILVVVDGVARLRAVIVVDWPAARLIVTDGLAAGDTLITDPAGISDGQTVKMAPL